MQRIPRVLTVLIFLVLPALRASAEERIGEAWEPGITEGISRQELERKDKRPEVILRQAELTAARRSDGTIRIVRLYLLARAYGIAGDVRSAHATYREVLQLAPRCYFANHDLAMLALQMDPPDRKSAEAYLRRSIQQHPRYVLGRKKLVSLLLSLGRKDEAQRLLREIVSLDPGGLDTRFLLARTLLDQGKLDEAEREIVILARQDSRSPAVQDLKASLFLARGRIDDAMKVYKRLADANPTAAQPLRGYVSCLDGKRKADPNAVDPEDWLWALERLYRLERDPESKKRLRTAIEEFRRIQRGDVPTAPESEGPPTAAQLVRILDTAPPDVRVRVLQAVYARGESLEKELLEALIRHMGPKSETSPVVRQWALRVLGRYGERRVVGLLRTALGDADRNVRAVGVDALVALAETGAPVRGAAFLILGLYRDARDVGLAGQARFAALDLVHGVLPGDLEDDEAAQRSAFETWWTGPLATESKINALANFHKVEDLFPEDILVPYMRDGNAQVADAAWRAMLASAKPVLSRGIAAARRDWLTRLPPHREGALKGPESRAMRATLDAWIAAQPGP